MSVMHSTLFYDLQCLSINLHQLKTSPIITATPSCVGLTLGPVMVNLIGEMKKKGLFLFHIYDIDHRKANLVNMCSSMSPLFKTTILPNIWLILWPWQPLFYYLGIVQQPNIALIKT